MSFRMSRLVLPIALGIGLSPIPCFSQSAPDKRPKLKDFGSSIKRLKWDPVTKKAVDTKPPDQTSRSSDDDVVRIETVLVTSDILVLDGKGNLVENLTAEDFIISEDGQPQGIAHFHRGDDAAVGRSIVLIFDYSRSQNPFLRRSIDAAKLMVEKLGPLDLMAGGWTEFLEKPEQADRIYNRILDDISRRYIIAYYPTNKELDGKRRKIKFEIKGHPEYHNLGRNSYFAPVGP